MGNKKSVFIDIDEEFLAKHKEQLKEAAIDHYGTGTDGKTQLIYTISEEQADNVDTRIEEIDADNNTITVVADIDLIEVATKKLNKAKTLLETIK